MKLAHAITLVNLALGYQLPQLILVNTSSINLGAKFILQ